MAVPPKKSLLLYRKISRLGRSVLWLQGDNADEIADCLSMPDCLVYITAICNDMTNADTV